MKAHVLLFTVLGAILFSSCQHFRIEKRRYSSGYYINTGSDKKDKVATAHTEEPGIVKQEDRKSEPVKAIEDVTTEAPAQSTPAEVNNPKADPAKNTGETPAEEKVAEPATPIITQNAPPTAEESPATTPADDVTLILLVILAILLPPIAVLLYEGITTRFWITLILCLLSGGFFFSPFIGILWLVAIIIALMVVLGAI